MTKMKPASAMNLAEAIAAETAAWKKVAGVEHDLNLARLDTIRTRSKAADIDRALALMLNGMVRLQDEPVRIGYTHSVVDMSKSLSKELAAAQSEHGAQEDLVIALSTRRHKMILRAMYYRRRVCALQYAASQEGSAA